MKNFQKRIIIWAVLVLCVLMIPFLGHFPWSMNDYIFAGVILYGSAFGYEYITRSMKNTMHKVLVGIGALGIVLVIWAWAVA